MADTVETVRFQRPVPYAEGLSLQYERRDAICRGERTSALFLLEHEPVVTLGRKAREGNLRRSRDELARLGIEVCETDRGGDVTYHGPGQLVAYPLLNLRKWRASIRWYLRTLEQAVMDQLAGYGLNGERVEGLTGVWVGGAKVAAIGVGLRNWVTYHGVALNVAPDMSHFDLIVPCGIEDKPVTSLARLLGQKLDMDRAAADFERCFRNAFRED